jgi:lipid A 3-O-deacylase
MIPICRRSLGVAALVLTGQLLLAAPLDAQAAAYRLTFENDYFTFWLPRSERPDREYSNGVVLHFPAPSFVSATPRLAGAPACTGAEWSTDPCVSASLAIGHRIYTPTPWRPLPGERPYAGWLFSAVEVERSTSQRRRQIGLEVGITGRASLGQAIQTFVHDRRGYGGPVGWEDQIGFEPAFSVRAMESRLLATPVGNAGLGALVGGSIGASLGTLHSGASAGVEARAGVRPPHPWRPGERVARSGLSLYALAGASQHLVVRNLMLDGAAFRDSPSVERLPLVTEWTAGVGARVGRLGIEYRAVVRGREYATQAEPHPYGSFSVFVGR